MNMTTDEMERELAGCVINALHYGLLPENVDDFAAQLMPTVLRADLSLPNGRPVKSFVLMVDYKNTFVEVKLGD